MNKPSASERQVQAALPNSSTWLSANAGSGKTRVLTDRVARLLLGGVEPQHILCLTYTKAAASEMQNRLFRRLGEWAMKPDADLRKSLAELGEGHALTADLLAQARRLFARAIETPGGLRIQTIHSFCATLLRRFPLEAGVSPQFTELDDRAAKLLRQEIIEELAETIAPDVVAEVARLWTGEDFIGLVDQIAHHRADFEAPFNAATADALFGLPAGTNADALISQVFLGDEQAWMPAVIAALLAKGGNDEKAGRKLQPLNLAAPSMTLLSSLEDVFLFGKDAKAPFTAKIGTFPTKATQATLAPYMDRLENLMRRVEGARETRMALNAKQRALTLHRFARAFLPIYAQRKAERGWLDFDDLITRARHVLTDQGVAAWILFRLDGGIDHILVDEAQDTSPEQWQVIESLAAEFTAGSGARDVERTLFVVGDKKQSIYSFQGADVAAFDEKLVAFRDRFASVERPFQSLELEHSFRSSPAVLRVVDDTFGDRFPQALGGRVEHLAFRSELAGRVDLWPVVEKADGGADDDWQNPVDLITEEHHAARLAAKIADEIKSLIETGTQIPTADGPRPVHAGDFLILVQRRSDLFAEVIRACKARDLPIAGADRLKLGAEQAVKDITALLSFLATPEDDLSLAALLRSPLCGWSEDDLYRLAHGRPSYLWQQLRAHDGHPDTLEMLNDLRNQADYLRPFDLIERALTRHDGRRRLLARLGAEAEDGIDELLSQALAYERMDVPSLTGFLIWLETDEVEVKRQTDSEGQRIRVMTVHGAKGLEAPIVILPDTGDRRSQERDEIYTISGHPVWKTPADESPAAIAAARAARQAREADENLRLLYVALTRARVWLIVCAAGEVKSEQCWYNLVKQGLSAAGSEPVAGGIQRHAFGHWPEPKLVAAAPIATITTPDWLNQSAPKREHPAPTLSPSALGGAKAMGGGIGDEDALERGTALHLLLEHLPALPRADWDAAAAQLIDNPTLRADVLAEAVAVLTAPELAHLFGPALTEVSITADYHGQRLFGTIDRLLVGAEHVLAIDYKSNRVIPTTTAQVPDGIVQQMAAYAHALKQIYPNRRIETAILWTAGPVLMPIG